MKALVLSGGAIKGAYQVGALYEVLSDYKPDIILGISVGSLNSLLLLTSYIKSGYDWKTTSEMMYWFWKNNIKKPSDIINKKSPIRLAYEIATNKFESLVDNKPLKDLIQNYTKNVNLTESKNLLVYAGAVDFNTGLVKYINNRHPDYLEYAIASSCIPIQFPYLKLRDKILYDGGLVDVVPIGPAIDYGADDILVISTHPIEKSYKQIEIGNVYKMLERTIDIMVHNTVSDDLKLLELYNKALQSVNGNPEWLKGKRKINYKIICPPKPLDIDVTKFDESDIDYMIRRGRIDALNLFYN